MASSSSISFMFMTYCLLIVSICQINLALADQNQPVSLQQQQDGQTAFFNEYFRQHHPVNQQRESSLEPPASSDENINGKSMSRLNWFKRDLRSKPSNKRMLCFFHAVNCFG